MSELLYLIDVYSLVFQVFHAIPEMTSPRGLPTNAVFGFTRDILNLLAKRPTHVVCAADSTGPGEREKLFPRYKANRAEMPADLEPQFPMIAEVIQAFGFPVVEYPGWEADDVMATLAQRALERGMRVVIVSNDKDVRQLLGPQVSIYLVRKEQTFSEPELEAEWGIRPDQVVDFQALVGDSVDNVPGVPLVGPKKASALLRQFGSLEDVLQNADLAPGAKLRENLKQHADLARISKRLVTLRRDLPLEVDWGLARVGRWNVPRLVELFGEFGFRRFADEVRHLDALLTPAGPGNSPPGANSRAPRAQPRSLFGDEAPPAEPAAQAPLPADGEPAAANAAPRRPLHYRLIDTPEKLAAFAERLGAQREFCLDLETTDLDPLRAEIVGWAFSWEPHAGDYIPVQGPPGQQVLNAAAVIEALAPILRRADIRVSNQNIKYDLLVLRRAGIDQVEIGVDPMVASFLLEAGARGHGLDELARRHLNHAMIPITDLIGKGRPQKRMNEVDVARVAEYAVEDAEVAWQLSRQLADQLRREGLWSLYWDLERPLIDVLVEMQWNGVRVDARQLEAQSDQAGRRLQALRQEIHALAGREFNIDSPKQLQSVLFDELRLPVIKKIKTGASTDQDVLEQLAHQHPLPSKLLEHRALSKLKSTYLDALPQMINPRTGRIHTSFNQVAAATGRLSSSDPNLQNIPIRTEEGRLVRRAFLPREEGWLLLAADYSQIELRMLAHFSDDEVLKESFRRGDDIHTSVAAAIFGVAPAAVDGQMRRVAKAVNFGVIYGQSAFGLAAALGIDQDQAQRFIDDYFTRYAGVDAFIERLLRECARSGFATTIRGRRRAIAGIRPQPQPNRQRNLPERTAINTVIQGSAADLIKQAMLNLHRRLQDVRFPARLLLQIHDELVLEAPAESIAELARLVRQEMEHAMELAVPLVVDVSAGPNWLDVETVAAA